MKNDFTHLVFGSLVSGGRTIIHCPRCRRLGALECLPNGVRRCIHVEDSALLDEGVVVEPMDVCELAGPRSVRPDELVLLAERWVAGMQPSEPKMTSAPNRTSRAPLGSSSH